MPYNRVVVGDTPFYLERFQASMLQDGYIIGQMGKIIPLGGGEQDAALSGQNSGIRFRSELYYR